MFASAPGGRPCTFPGVHLPWGITDRKRVLESPAMAAQENQDDQDKSVPWTGLIHLLIVYVVWGSTYLAIRVAVRPGSGFSPFLLGASRTFVAAGLLLAWNLLRGQRILPTRREWATLLPAGLMLWVGGNGLVNWAEQRADSGYAALLVGAMPIWVVLMESLVDRRRPTFRLIGALVIGFAGLGVLSWPVLRNASGAGPAQAVALVLAPLSWGAGSIYLTRRAVQLGPTASSAWQHLAGACGFLVVALCAREPWPQPTAGAWAAWGYLVVAGSIVAFTSFLTALRLLPTALVTTYTYVNPVIAVLLGWLILGERITAWTVAGTILILAGVAAAFGERRVARAKSSHERRAIQLPE
jgi:drug/metabolite transporter (DMT)-like permease